MLIEQLTTKQRGLGYDDRQFAELLGVPRPTWQAYRTGRIRPSTRVLRVAVRAFPDLADAVLSFLAGGDSLQAVPDCPESETAAATATTDTVAS